MAYVGLAGASLRGIGQSDENVRVMRGIGGTDDSVRVTSARDWPQHPCHDNMGLARV